MDDLSPEEMQVAMQRFIEFYGKNVETLCSARFYRDNMMLFQRLIHGLGLLNYETREISGERRFLDLVLLEKEKPVVFDVGANEGEYAASVKSTAPGALIYAFEPHPVTYKKLKAKAAELGFLSLNLGFSDRRETLTIYDYKENDGSSHASLYKGVIEENFRSESTSHDVELIAVDDFVQEHDVQHIDLLKIDTEGHELKVFQGAGETLRQGKVEFIQFEFNEMNVYSRTFFKDIYDLIGKDYAFFRLLPDGMAPLGDYSPLLYELFVYQNIAAVRKDSLLLQSDV